MLQPVLAFAITPSVSLSMRVGLEGRYGPRARSVAAAESDLGPALGRPKTGPSARSRGGVSEKTRVRISTYPAVGARILPQ
ncbi:hypothetical protein NDU88_007487 [Pleurodeles waltl]|uniref:Secreted protein n=1 Tax=Pleurodeles waltl TaxID=8319 RepID=A0AAV7N6H3_PLEWA|nr:hypothetical protein NDU88_007487 [Pleurodeles waltl]